MPTLAVGDGSQGYSTVHSLGSESTNAYRPMQVGEDPIVSPRRSSGYVALPAQKQRTHGYGQVTPTYDTAEIGQRRDQEDSGPRYGTGDLSAF